MRIRVEGTQAETAAAVAWLVSLLDVQEVSSFYANRGHSQLGRVYLTISPPTAAPPPKRVPAERADQPTQTGAQVQRTAQRAELDTDKK